MSETVAEPMAEPIVGPGESSPSLEPGAAPSLSTFATPVAMRTGGGVMAYLRKVGAVTTKELRAELRAKESFSTMVAFGLLAVLIFGLAFDLRVPESSMVVPGVIWVAILFTGVLGLNRSFGAELDRGSLAALLLAPVDRSAIYFGKLLAQLVFLLLTEAVILPVTLIIFDVNVLQPWILLGVFLGTLGYVAVGTLFAALTVSSRAARIDAAHPAAPRHGAGLYGRSRPNRQRPRWPRIRRLPALDMGLDCL